MTKKTSLGRQKIAMAKITNKNRLQVTFSKRRTGLFKKASELCTLCGVEIAILVFSPTEKVFAFGHPDVDSIIDRFIVTNRSLESKALKMFESYGRNDNIRVLTMMLGQILDQLEEERDHGKKLDQSKAAMEGQHWWLSPVEKLNLSQLEQLRISLEELKKNVKAQTVAISAVGSSATAPPFLAVDSVNHMAPLVGNGMRNADEFHEHKHDLDQDNNVGSFSHFFNFHPQNGLL